MCLTANIKALAKELLKHGRLGFRVALSLRGKLTCAVWQLFFRASAPICLLLSIWAKVGTERKLSEELLEAIGSIGETLEMSGPRVIKENTGLRPVLVFTDGACEEESTSIGGVLFHDDDQVEAFGAVYIQEPEPNGRRKKVRSRSSARRRSTRWLLPV